MPRVRRTVTGGYDNDGCGSDQAGTSTKCSTWENQEVCTTTGEVCGTPSPALRKALEEAGVRIYAPFQTLSR